MSPSKIVMSLFVAVLLSGCSASVWRSDYPMAGMKETMHSMYVSEIYPSGRIHVAIYNSPDLIVGPSLDLTNIPLGTKVWICIRTNGVLVPLVE